MPETTGIRALPFTTFNFKVEFTLEGQSNPLCDAAFAECDGLEMTIAPKTYQEGGNNISQVHLIGPVTYGQLSLKRGMTSSFDLWDWFDQVVANGGYGVRAEALVVMLDSHRQPKGDDRSDTDEVVKASFILTRCLPIKLKAPGLNAKDGQVAIEELQVAYERLQLQRP